MSNNSVQHREDYNTCDKYHCITMTIYSGAKVKHKRMQTEPEQTRTPKKTKTGAESIGR